MANDSGSGASPLVVAIVAVLSAAIAGAASFGVGYLTFASKDQELRVHLVEIAIGILRADPTKEGVANARGWALDVIEKNSGQPFSKQDREALLHKPLPSFTATARIEFGRYRELLRAALMSKDAAAHAAAFRSIADVLQAGGGSADDLRAMLKEIMGTQIFLTTTTSQAGINAADALEKELRDRGMTIVSRQAWDPAQISDSKVSCYGADTCKDAKALVPLLRARGYTLGEVDTSNLAEDNSSDEIQSLMNRSVIRIVLLDPKPSQPATSESPLQGRQPQTADEKPQLGLSPKGRGGSSRGARGNRSSSMTRRSAAATAARSSLVRLIVGMACAAPRLMQRRTSIDLRQQSMQINRHIGPLNPHTPVRNQLLQHPLEARLDLRQDLEIHLGLIHEPPPDRANLALDPLPRPQNLGHQPPSAATREFRAAVGQAIACILQRDPAADPARRARNGCASRRSVSVQADKLPRDDQAERRFFLAAVAL